MEPINLFGNTVSDLENLMLEIGEKPYRARQLFKWFYKLGENEFERMTDLSRDLRERLSGRFSFIGMTPEETVVSSDGSEKFLYRLGDGALIESVLLKVLAKDPENRYADIHVFVSELDNLLAGKPVDASTIKTKKLREQMTGTIVENVQYEGQTLPDTGEMEIEEIRVEMVPPQVPTPYPSPTPPPASARMPRCRPRHAAT